ncbi:hypothetical protein [Thalassotalea sp. G2M2-11]|uniref:hypothetical protein n=1 Tax=Thalassotalea sp. G2M2-11 TaxID=2787627 RepID=UPI0019D1C343|nr:hypothetical protein [Thalassotalea sp. G2M2-11]
MKTSSTDSTIIVLENWLQVLLSTYGHHPSQALAKIIHYYIGRVLKESDRSEQPFNKYQYLRMKKYWYWRSL